jgi:hypothetical protein
MNRNTLGRKRAKRKRSPDEVSSTHTLRVGFTLEREREPSSPVSMDILESLALQKLSVVHQTRDGADIPKSFRLNFKPYR